MFIGVTMWAFASIVGGWTVVAKIMGILMGSIIVLGLCLAAIIAAIYLLTIFRSQRYVSFLRKAGYDAPTINKQSARAFAALIIAGIITTAMSGLMGVSVYQTHLCNQAGECISDSTNFFVSGIILSIFGVTGITCLVGAYKMWRKSHDQLHAYCEEVKSGHTPKLPRFRI